MNIINIDDYIPVERVIERDFKSKRFIIVVLDDYNQLSSYVPIDLSEMEMLYMIQALKDRHKDLFYDL